MNPRFSPLIAGLCLGLGPFSGAAQEYGEPDRGAPGDAMIQRYLAREADRIHATFTQDLVSQTNWLARRPQYLREYFYMLGLWPLPERTPLHATVTGTLKREGYVVDLLHFQSRPHLYVTANLYRPADAPSGRRLPAVLYVCGHSPRGRAGNKTAYQSNGIWFARHGYLCLMLDTLQLGEIASIHHGTYRENRWWWHSRGYTPAGVECWNGIRALDYLVTRPDVDPERIAVTGISGGGAATFWIAAADERVKVAVPISGMSDLPAYVNHRVINGHCDCMFLYNTFQWPWTRIAALIAPRPLLFTNSDHDNIFPMDGNERVINRLERVYSGYGRADFVDAMVSRGKHAYRQDIRQAAYRFINTYLKNDPREITDSEVDLVVGRSSNRVYPIPIDQLRVFPTDADLPKDEWNTTIDERFVPLARVKPPADGRFAAWRTKLLAELRRVTFRPFPERIPPARLTKSTSAEDAGWETEPGIVIPVRKITSASTPAPRRIVLGVQNADPKAPVTDFLRQIQQAGDTLYLCEPRGVGATRWTRKNPPNYVERSHVLLGRTVDEGRVWDLIAVARALRERHGGVPVILAGEGAGGVLAAYAALWEPDIAGVILRHPPTTHMDNAAPQFLNVLRVCDIPDALGLLAPRSVTLIGSDNAAWQKTAAIYAAAHAAAQLRFRPSP